MSKEEYISLSLHDRAEVLWVDGQFLETIAYYGFAVQLYSLHGFFVEIYYNAQEMKIEKVEPVEGEAMNKYLGRIKIDTF